MTTDSKRGGSRGAPGKQKPNGALGSNGTPPKDMPGAAAGQHAKDAGGGGDEMHGGTQVAIGCYLLVLGIALLALLPWAWSAAYYAHTKRGPRVHFLTAAFTPTPAFSLVVIVILTAMLGSIAVLTLAFSNRAGCKTLNTGWEWWYFTRPITAAALGALFYMSVIDGYFHLTPAKGHAPLIVAAVTGGLAGLFTDQILDKMRHILGLKKFSHTSTDKNAAQDTGRGTSPLGPGTTTGAGEG